VGEQHLGERFGEPIQDGGRRGQWDQYRQQGHLVDEQSDLGAPEQSRRIQSPRAVVDVSAD